MGPRDVEGGHEGGHEGEGDLLAQLAQGGFAALPVGVSAEGIPEVDRQALCSPSSAATESSGAVELRGVAVLPSNGLVAQPSLGVQRLGDGLAKGFQQLAAVF